MTTPTHASKKNAMQGWKALIVEDEPDNMDVALRILRFYGVETASAVNGKEALAVLQTFKPDFIVSDLSMPVMDGWEFCFQLQQDRTTADIPIFALTAHAMVGDRERAISAGFHNYMTKPLTPSTFMQQLLSLLVQIPHLEGMLSEQLKDFSTSTTSA